MPSKDLHTPGPKRILASDGGGIRGAITLGFLKKLETNLRERHNNDKLVLSDYFGPYQWNKHFPKEFDLK